MLCVEEFRFELNTVERNGMYYENVVDLGTKLLVNGEGACNSGVELKLEKNGSNVVKSSTTYAFLVENFQNNMFSLTILTLENTHLLQSKKKLMKNTLLHFI